MVPEKYRFPFPQPFVSDGPGGDRVLMDQFLGDHFTLLTTMGGDDDGDRHLIKTVRVVGSMSDDSKLTGGEQMLDLDGVVEQWLGEVGADAVLLRPDRVPFGLYSGADASAPAVLEDLPERLQATGPVVAETVNH